MSASDTPADSFTKLAITESPDSELRRRLTYLMAFRVLVITLVMGVTTVLFWLGDVDLTLPNSLFLYGVSGSTYVLTLVYARVVLNSTNLERLALGQIVADLFIASLIVHVTGGAQSAYTFFYPLAIIASTILRSRKSTVLIALAAAALFLSTSYLGWISFLPTPAGQTHLPTGMSSLDFGRAIILNLAAIVAIGTMSVQLAAQLQKSIVDIEVHRTVAADLLSLHEDIVECLTSGLITINREGKILTINRAAGEILKCSPENSVGIPISKLSHPLGVFLNAIPVEEESRRGEVVHSTSTSTSNELFLGVSVSPLFDHLSKPVGRLINFQDLTEVKLLENHVKRAERLAVIGTLAAGVAHEIRNPLAAISGSIELLATQPDGNEEENAALMSIVHREIERLNTLITELLEYSNPRPTKTTQFDLNEVIEDILRVFAQNATFSTISVTYERSGEGPLTISADTEKIRQLLWNLLLNGAEAALDGGGKVWINIDTEGEFYAVRFCNNGPAISDEIREKVFDPFFTTKAKGTGLGLSTVHSTVMDHHGSIEIQNIETGVCFEVRLPIV
ncbi:MAG: PAS domain-containing protein [Kofleriaceae bacterium]|nr:PAS domain-containing protein [Kofleriaceae bacterium]